MFVWQPAIPSRLCDHLCDWLLLNKIYLIQFLSTGTWWYAVPTKLQLKLRNNALLICSTRISGSLGLLLTRPGHGGNPFILALKNQQIISWWQKINFNGEQKHVQVHPIVTYKNKSYHTKSPILKASDIVPISSRYNSQLRDWGRKRGTVKTSKTVVVVGCFWWSYTSYYDISQKLTKNK